MAVQFDQAGRLQHAEYMTHGLPLEHLQQRLVSYPADNV